MNQIIRIEENGIYMVFKILENGWIRFLHFSSRPLQEEEIVAESV